MDLANLLVANNWNMIGTNGIYPRKGSHWFLEALTIAHPKVKLSGPFSLEEIQECTPEKYWNDITVAIRSGDCAVIVVRLGDDYYVTSRVI